jgi:hypothetical protein
MLHLLTSGYWHYPEIADTTRLRRLSENEPDLRRGGAEIDVATADMGKIEILHCNYPWG